MIRNKRGLSVMIGYILLISFALVLAGIVYAYIKTYVPREITSCPDETSLFIKEYSCSNGELNLTIKNNGRFNVAGYFIHGANDSIQEVAVIDMVTMLKEGAPDQKGYQAAVVFDINVNNTLRPNEEVVNQYVLDHYIHYVEIIPMRFQEDNSRQKLVSCGNSVAKEIVSCASS